VQDPGCRAFCANFSARNNTMHLIFESPGFVALHKTGESIPAKLYLRSYRARSLRILGTNVQMHSKYIPLLRWYLHPLHSLTLDAVQWFVGKSPSVVRLLEAHNIAKAHCSEAVTFYMPANTSPR